MLPDHIDAAAASCIGKGDTEGVGTVGLYYFFAVDALIESDLFFIGWTFTVAAGLVGFLS